MGVRALQSWWGLNSPAGPLSEMCVFGAAVCACLFAGYCTSLCVSACVSNSPYLGENEVWLCEQWKCLFKEGVVYVLTT